MDVNECWGISKHSSKFKSTFLQKIFMDQIIAFYDQMLQNSFENSLLSNLVLKEFCLNAKSNISPESEQILSKIEDIIMRAAETNLQKVQSSNYDWLKSKIFTRYLTYRILLKISSGSNEDLLQYKNCRTKLK